MPTYGYECLTCANQFEVFQSIKDAPMTVCESCGGALRKRVYPVGIAFKGSGFYVNDYAPKSSPESSSPPASETKSEITSETKTDAPKTESPKPEAKTEAPKTEAKTESKTPAAV